MTAPPRGDNSRPDQIVRAAARLFGHYGFRKTSVDLIAREAEVAKPTLYAHFADKEAIFVAVCQQVMDGVLAGARAALDQPGVIDRITAVLAAKFSTIFELVHASPHARELLESQAAQARELVEQADAAFSKLLVEALRAAVRRKELVLDAAVPSTTALAHMLMQAAHGAGYGAKTGAEHRAHLAALVAALLRPMLP